MGKYAEQLEIMKKNNFKMESGGRRERYVPITEKESCQDNQKVAINAVLQANKLQGGRVLEMGELLRAANDTRIVLENNTIQEKDPKLKLTIDTIDPIWAAREALAKNKEQKKITESMQREKRMQLRGIIKEKVEETEDLVEDMVKNGLSGLAVSTLRDVMEDDEAPQAVRAAVARYVVDRILGKPTQKEEVVTTQVEYKINVGFELKEPTSVKKLGLVFDDDVFDEL
jgi:hypothetical protein